MTKQELVDRLEAAGVEGFSMANTKAELEQAAARLPEPNPNRERYANPRNAAHRHGGRT